MKAKAFIDYDAPQIIIVNPDEPAFEGPIVDMPEDLLRRVSDAQCNFSDAQIELVRWLVDHGHAWAMHAEAWDIHTTKDSPSDPL